MSDLLDNKSDAEIEEIYGMATLEDLQNMLTQEKSLNRRRLLRKAIRTKTVSLPSMEPKSVIAETTIKSHPCITGTTSSNTEVLRPQDSPGDPSLLKTLTSLQKELSDETDIIKRRQLRKQIQGLEEKTNATKKNVSDPPASQIPAQCSLPPKEEKKNKTGLDLQLPREAKVTEKPTTKENLSKSVDKPAVERRVDVIDSPVRTAISTPTHSAETTNQLAIGNKPKFNILQNSNSVNATVSPSPSRVTSANIQSKTSSRDTETKLNTPVIKPKHPEEKKPIDPIPPSQKPLPISNSIEKSLPAPIADKPAVEVPKPLAKANVSRVNSVKQMFETPPIITPQKRAGNVKPIDDDEINNLVNQALNKDKAGSSQDKVDVNKLALPQPKNRKTSQTGIIMMIPQWKKMAQTARSSVQAMKEQIIAFCQHNTKEYQNVSIVNYSKSWADGLAFCALIHHFYPDSFDFKALSSDNPGYNFKLAFDTAKKYAGIEPLMDPEDMMVLETPDQKCVYTYVQFIYHALKKHPRNVVKRVENADK